MWLLVMSNRTSRHLLVFLLMCSLLDTKEQLSFLVISLLLQTPVWMVASWAVLQLEIRLSTIERAMTQTLIAGLKEDSKLASLLLLIRARFNLPLTNLKKASLSVAIWILSRQSLSILWVNLSTTGTRLESFLLRKTQALLLLRWI